MRETARLIARGARAAMRPMGAGSLSVPTDRVIRRPGRYRLNRDLEAVTGAVVTVKADNVTLDLGGHQVSAAPGEHEAPTVVIDASGISNFVLCNGVLCGGWRGIDLTGAIRARIDGVAIDGFHHIGILAVAVRDLEITGCRVAVRVRDVHRPEGERYAVGVNASGRGIAVDDNAVEIDCAPDSGPVESIGVLVGARSRRTRVAGNRVASREPVPASYGVWVGAEAEVEVTRNRIENVTYGVTVADGVVACVRENAFACARQAPPGPGETCAAAIFARAADLAEEANDITGYASTVTRYDPAGDEEALPSKS